MCKYCGVLTASTLHVCMQCIRVLIAIEGVPPHVVARIVVDRATYTELTSFISEMNNLKVAKSDEE